MIDDDTFELLRRRLTEQVTKDVRTRLFWVYSLVGMAVIVAFTYANWDFVEDTKKDVKAAAEKEVATAIDEVKEDIEEIRKNIGEQIGQMKFVHKNANLLIGKVSTQLDTLDMKAGTLKSINEAITTLSLERKSMGSDLEKTKRSMDTLEKMATHLRELAEEMKRIAPESKSAADAVIAQVNEAEKKIARVQDQNTVYVQFAGGLREDIQSVSQRLKTEGWIIPGGEERTSNAVGRKEIRYFHTQDKPAAEKLANDASMALVDTGFESIDIQATDFTRYPNIPKPGVLEFWVQIPLR